MRDALKFDNMPAMSWNRAPIPGDSRTFDGIRLPATAHELQQIADLLGMMLMTPKVIDLVWLQAGVKFDSVVNIRGKIVAVSNIHDVHEAVEKEIAETGGDDGRSIISCVGKYWCLVEELKTKAKVQGDEAACNYGWFAKKASGPGLTSGTQCWQRPAYKHNKRHLDPSQVIRLMSPFAQLESPDGTEQNVDLRDIAQNDQLCPMITHNRRPLTYLRQKGVAVEEPLSTGGEVVLPELPIFGRR